MRFSQWAIVFFFVAGIYACNKEVIATEEPFAFVQPTYFPAPAYDLNRNPITKEKFELGRKLFYDRILSSNKTISCGSCHIQTSAFTHHGHTVSHGIYDRLGTRNAPPIMNLAWNNSFMWDGGIADLDLQPIAPITNFVEMDDSLSNVLNKLQNSSEYPALFEKAFGSSQITGTNFFKALSQFMLLCNSINSKYDSVKMGLVSFSREEDEGYHLVLQKCGECHTEPLFTDFSFRNNGIGVGNVDDLGRGDVSGYADDYYKFKVPSLRNLSYTAPFMHDGRMASIDDVLNHYSSGVQQTQNLDPLLQNGIPLTDDEKSEIKAFLKTLDDKKFLLDKRFAEE